MTKITRINVDVETGNIDIYLVIPYVDDSSFKIYIDEYFNYNNIYSQLKDKHSYYFEGIEQITVAYIADPSIADNERLCRLTAHFTDVATLDMKHVIVEYTLEDSEEKQSVEGVYYDKGHLYNMELDKIMLQCDVCLDTKAQELIIVLTFREQMLDKALMSGNYVDAMKYYTGIARLVDVELYNQKLAASTRTCINGTCNIL